MFLDGFSIFPSWIVISVWLFFRGDSNGSDKSSAAGANGMGESGSGGSEEGSDKGLGNPDFTRIHQRVEGWGGLLGILW